MIEETKAHMIPSCNDVRIITGQATAALELFEDVGELDVLLVPVGGGGLISGSALAMASLCPKTQVIGAEPKNVDDAQRSLASGKIIPLAGG